MACSICRQSGHNKLSCWKRGAFARGSSPRPHPTGTTPITWTLFNVEGQPCAWLEGDIDLHVKGEFYNQDHLRQFKPLVGQPALVPAWLAPEPENEHDRNALRVDIGGGKAGYVPREEAVDWQPVIRFVERQSGRKVACRCTLFTSEDRSGNEIVEVILRLPPKPPAVTLTSSANAPPTFAATKPRRPPYLEGFLIMAWSLFCLFAVVVIGLAIYGASQGTASTVRQQATVDAGSRPPLGDRFKAPAKAPVRPPPSGRPAFPHL